MKILKSILTVVLFAILTFSTYSCKNDSKSKDAQTEQAKQGKEYTSAYICASHCKDSGSAKPGKCSACGKAYQKNKDHKGHEHNHDGHNHDGHNHDGHDHSGHDHSGHNHN